MLSFKKLLLVSCVAAIAHSPVFAAKTLRMGYDHTNEHPTGQAIIKFGQLVEEYTKGEYKIKLYASGQLGDERKMLEQVQNNVLDLTKTATVLMTSYAPEYSVLVMPYMFKSPDHFSKVMFGKIGDDMKMLAADKGLVGLAFLYDEPRSYYAKAKAIVKPEDLKGLKMRVINSADAIAVAKTMGATPTPIPWGEVYTSLQQGIVDGAEGGPSALTLYKHGDIAKFFSNTQHVVYPGLFVIGTKAWKGMKEADKAAFLRAAKEASEFQKKEFIALQDKALSELPAMGVTISKPDLAAFQARAKLYYAEHATDPKVKALVDKIQAE